MKIIRLISLLIVIASSSQAQTTQTKAVVSGIVDSLVYAARFDERGNYLLEYRDTNGVSYFIQNGDSLPPMDFYMGSYVSRYRKVADKSIAYYTSQSPQVMGPFSGEDISRHRYPMSPNEVYAASVFLEGDTIQIYFQDALIHSIDTFSNASLTINGIKAGQLKAKRNYFSSDDWMKISDNGHYIACIENNGKYLLYNDGQLIDSSENRISALTINNHNDYTYAKGRKPKQDEPYDYSYIFFIHANDSIFGPVRTTWDRYLLSNGAYYYSGDDAGPYYILVNDTLLRNITPHNLTLLDQDNYAFSFSKGKKNFIMVNGETYRYKFPKVLLPSLDTLGNFACYGMRNYYIYTYVNGVVSKKPIVGHGVRPKPLYISPTGTSVHYFKTDNATYIYKDDSLLLDPVPSESTLIITDLMNELPYRKNDQDKPNIGQSLIYIQVDTVSYLLVNGTLTTLQVPLSKRTYGSDKTIGEFAAVAIESHGFFYLQRTGNNSWTINIDNDQVMQLREVDRVYHKHCFFSENKLIFYYLKEGTIYQSTIER